MSLIPYTIEGYPSGLEKNKKSFALIDTAFPELENAYCWRERIIKREGIKLVGRLQRKMTTASIGVTGASPWSFNIYTAYGIIPEATAEINPGSLIISINPATASGAITGYTIAADAEVTSAGHGLSSGDVINISGVVVIPGTGPDTINVAGPYTIEVITVNTFKLGIASSIWGQWQSGGTWTHVTGGPIQFVDQGNGTLTSTTPGNSGTINYLTGDVVLTHTAGAGVATSASFGYFPSLPVMGILTREIDSVNLVSTLYFDTKYTYLYDGNNFSEYLPASGITWQGTDSDFFWGANYRGAADSSRLLFVTNFLLTSSVFDPMRYTNGSAWTTFAPLVSATDTLFQARIIIPYYGRLLALNTYEGPTGFATTSTNFFNRCRFSQVGSPIQVDAWRSDLFGKGGFIDAPINEEITSAIFYKNTLIVFFERSTWQLRYVGEIGLPFIWERISSDFGCESTFSTILFDQGVLAVGDRAIVSSTGVNVQRIDTQIPDQVFEFNNLKDGLKRVQGIRDFKKELVYWCYSDGALNRKFPNYTLLFNYRNNTFAKFRNNVTAFGWFNSPSNVTWDSQSVTWDSQLVTWDDTPNAGSPLICSGNQQGFIHLYGYPDIEVLSDSSINALDQESLSITAIDRTTSPIKITVLNHNLETNEIIYIVGLNFVDAGVSLSSDLNNKFYQVTFIDENTLGLSQWDETVQRNETPFSFTPAAGTGTYFGGGMLALFPVMKIKTKDFSPFDKQGLGMKLAYVDFLTDAQPYSQATVELYINSSPDVVANLDVGNTTFEQSTTAFGQIVGATQANPTVITTLAPHGLVSGDKVQISGVVGMTSGALSINNEYTITYVDELRYSLNGSNTTAYTAYISGGIYIQSNYPYYTVGSNYEWHRYYGGCNGQFVAVKITYSNALMNNMNTHRKLFTLNAMQLWIGKGTRSIY